MNGKGNLKTMVITLMVISFTLVSWLVSSSVCTAGQKLHAVTTLFPLQEMARAVGGDRASVDLLLPPGAEPHEWDPKPSDMVKLAKADIFIYLGAGMEPWVNSLLESVNNPSLRVIKASEGLPVLDNLKSEDEETDHHHAHDVKPGDEEKDHHHAHDMKAEDEEADYHHHAHGRMDPHLWLDFSYDQIIVAQIAKTFSEQDPDGSDFYHQNALKYQKKLADLDQKYKEGLKNCRHREIFLGGHSAFAYLARRYHLEQIPVYGISPDAEPSPKRLAEITDLARKQHIKAIYFEELVSDKMAKTLAEEVGAMVLILNPGANLTREHLKSGVTFISLMEQNLENLQKGQVCE